MSTTPSYATNDPKGWCEDPRRGAALGRYAKHTDGLFTGKLVLRRVRLDVGGYDALGTYWGLGLPLYWYADADGQVDATLRAPDRDAAKREIRSLRYPFARFFR